MGYAHLLRGASVALLCALVMLVVPAAHAANGEYAVTDPSGDTEVKGHDLVSIRATIGDAGLVVTAAFAASPNVPNSMYKVAADIAVVKHREGSYYVDGPSSVNLIVSLDEKGNWRNDWYDGIDHSSGQVPEFTAIASGKSLVLTFQERGGYQFHDGEGDIHYLDAYAKTGTCTPDEVCTDKRAGTCTDDEYLDPAFRELGHVQPDGERVMCAPAAEAAAQTPASKQATAASSDGSPALKPWMLAAILAVVFAVNGAVVLFGGRKR